MKTTNLSIFITMNFWEIFKTKAADVEVSISIVNQPAISDEVFNFILKELNVNGNVCEIIDKNFEYPNKRRNLIENEYDLHFKDYRDINQEKRTNYINNNLNKSTIHKKLQKLNLNDVMMGFEATSLYPSVMWDENLFILK